MLDLYAVLGFPAGQEERRLSQDLLKAAYRRALLQAHPDKSAARTGETGSSHTVDEVTLAYKTLSDPAKQAEYLRERRLQRRANENGEDNQAHNVDSADLDDFDYDEELSCWNRGCRCGALKGFEITEDDLDREASHGSILVGCRDCSIWLQVHFTVVDDSEAPAAPETVNG